MFTIRVTPDDGPAYEVPAGTRDVYMWEKTGKGRSVGQLQGEGMSISALYELTHLAARRQHMTTESLDDFVKHNDIDPIEDDDEPDPTQSGASTEQ